MVFRASLSFSSEASDVVGWATKFGGQPTWVSGPEWPLNRRSGTPMRFVGQIRVADALPPRSGTPFPDVAMMAYLFVTDGDTGTGTEADSATDALAENAVILQPGRQFRVATSPLPVGPTVTDEVAQPACWTVAVAAGDDPPFVPTKTYLRMGSYDWQTYLEALRGPKLGGTPVPRGPTPFPYNDASWQLLFQARASTLPFPLEDPSADTVSVFINRHLTSARLHCQTRRIALNTGPSNEGGRHPAGNMGAQ